MKTKKTSMQNISDQTISKPKKRLAKKTKILLIVLSCILVVVLSGGGVLIYFQNQGDPNYVPPEQNPHNFNGLLARPDFSGSVDSNIPTEEAALIEYAYSLYANAAENAKNCPEMLAFSNCSTSFSVLKIVNYIDLDIVLIKNQEEFFRIDYRLNNNVPFLKIKGFSKQINDSLDLVITERYYANTSMENMLYQKVKTAYLENNLPTTIWNSDEYPLTEKEMPKEVFSSSQEGAFTLVGYTIKPETIKTASVSYDKKGKFYNVDLVFDCENPVLTENIVGLIRTGSGDPEANYNEMRMSFTVWDNGYLRSLSSYETWSASALGVKTLAFESVFDYNWMISYNSSDCDLSSYPDYILMKEQINVN